MSIDSAIKELLRQLRNNHNVTTDLVERQGVISQPFAIKMSAFYIVCGVVIHNDKILMMRESKKTCYGLWYLPAGKMEPRETIEDAMLREITEETGLHVQLLSLLCVESPNGSWLRLTFAARAIGGKLKTIDEGDKESLEAAWFPVDQILSNGIKLRARDILPLIRLGKQWFRMNRDDTRTHLLPKVVDHGHFRVRLLLFLVNDDRLSVFALRNEEGRLHLPEMRYARSTGNIISTCHHLHNKSDWEQHIECHGVVGVEHSGRAFAETDGIRVTVAMEIKKRHVALETISLGYEWLDLTDTKLKSDLFYLLHSKVCVPIL